MKLVKTIKNNTIMKKQEIIDAYNALTKEFIEYITQYKCLTCKSYNSNRIGDFCPSQLNWTKSDLQSWLDDRLSSIEWLKNQINIFREIQEVKSTEKGLQFMQELEDKRSYFVEKQKNLSLEMCDSFNDLLHKIGLQDWSVAERNTRRVSHIFGGTFFNIETNKYDISGLSIQIDKIGGKWQMLIGSPMRGSENITDKSDQYQWYKCYVTVVDNNELFIDWMNTTYQHLVDEYIKVEDEIKEVSEIISNPYDEWMKLNH